MRTALGSWKLEVGRWGIIALSAICCLLSTPRGRAAVGPPGGVFIPGGGGSVNSNAVWQIIQSTTVSNTTSLLYGTAPVDLSDVPHIGTSKSAMWRVHFAQGPAYAPGADNPGLIYFGAGQQGVVRNIQFVGDADNAWAFRSNFVLKVWVDGGNIADGHAPPAGNLVAEMPVDLLLGTSFLGNTNNDYSLSRSTRYLEIEQAPSTTWGFNLQVNMPFTNGIFIDLKDTVNNTNAYRKYSSVTYELGTLPSPWQSVRFRAAYTNLTAVTNRDIAYEAIYATNSGSAGTIIGIIGSMRGTDAYWPEGNWNIACDVTAADENAVHSVGGEDLWFNSYYFNQGTNNGYDFGTTFLLFETVDTPNVAVVEGYRFFPWRTAPTWSNYFSVSRDQAYGTNRDRMITMYYSYPWALAHPTNATTISGDGAGLTNLNYSSINGSLWGTNASGLGAGSVTNRGLGVLIRVANGDLPTIAPLTVQAVGAISTNLFDIISLEGKVFTVDQTGTTIITNAASAVSSTLLSVAGAINTRSLTNHGTLTNFGRVDVTGDLWVSGKYNGVKVYRALLTQVTSEATSGSLIVGHIYVIAALNAGDDFANVGYVSEGTPFTATGTTPTDWSNGTTVTDKTVSAPTVTVLENSFGGTLVWTYSSAGDYLCTLTSAFTANKTFLRPYNDYDAGSALGIQLRRTGNNTLQMTTGGVDNYLSEYPVEILVYP